MKCSTNRSEKGLADLLYTLHKRRDAAAASGKSGKIRCRLPVVYFRPKWYKLGFYNFTLWAKSLTERAFSDMLPGNRGEVLLSGLTLQSISAMMPCGLDELKKWKKEK